MTVKVGQSGLLWVSAESEGHINPLSIYRAGACTHIDIKEVGLHDSCYNANLDLSP